MKKCAVIGSINMDIKVGVPRFPLPGETLAGSEFQTVPGGKGANQAVALARLGADVRMAGLVGDDAFGSRYLEHFRANNVDVSAVDMVTGAATGVADILVNQEGENFIVIVPGANANCDLRWLDRALEHTADCDIILLQLEIPLETVSSAIARLHSAGKTIILDPAPAVPLSEQLLSQVDILTPNETELRIITSTLDDAATPAERIAHLIGDSDRMVIHKRGREGAYIGTRTGIVHVPGFKVPTVDTTAAGDTFNAGLALGLAMDMEIADAVRMANAAAALSVMAFGVQDVMPSMQCVQAFLAEHS